MIYKKNNAFTLTELLIALGIIGAIAALSIPSLISTVHNKVLTTQIKSDVASVQQLINDQMITKKTKNLSDTGFSSSTEFYKLIDKAQDCSDNVKCWGTSYRVIGGANSEATIPTDGIKLKNGGAMSYSLVAAAKDDKKDGDAADSAADDDADDDADASFAQIYVDVNGPDQPNIIGRDLYAFYITKKGQIKGADSASAATCDTPLECFQALMNNGWVMPKDSEYYAK